MAGPIVLLHGVPTTSSVWRHLAEPLSRHGRVIAPDVPGLGGAADPRRASARTTTFAGWTPACWQGWTNPSPSSATTWAASWA